MSPESESPKVPEEPQPGTPAADDLPERWSAPRKMELVLRLLRGETLDAVSRDSQVPAYELEAWHRVFLESGKRGLRTKAESEDRDPTFSALPNSTTMHARSATRNQSQ